MVKKKKKKKYSIYIFLDSSLHFTKATIPPMHKTKCSTEVRHWLEVRVNVPDLNRNNEFSKSNISMHDMALERKCIEHSAGDVLRLNREKIGTDTKKLFCLFSHVRARAGQVLIG